MSDKVGAGEGVSQGQGPGGAKDPDQAPPDPRQVARRAAGQAAAALVAPDMVLGLGTGDSAGWFIRALAERVRGGLRVGPCVPTSRRTAELAAQLGLPVRELDELGAVTIDLTVDGADEIDPALRLIKGGGGALLREKLVAHASRRLVVVADQQKRVPRLGHGFRLPVELVPFGVAGTLGRLQALLPGAALRLLPDGAPARSDGGNLIADAPLSAELSAEPAALHGRVKALLGVIETGLFVTEAERALIGAADGSVTELLRP